MTTTIDRLNKFKLNDLSHLAGASIALNAIMDICFKNPDITKEELMSAIFAENTAVFTEISNRF